MSCSGSNNNTPTPTTTTPITTEIVIDQETQKLFKAEENIPAVCEESKRLTQILQNRRNSALTIIRVAAVLSAIAITLITTIIAVCSGDTSKLSAATLYNIAQTLALHSNGTSNTSKPVF